MKLSYGEKDAHCHVECEKVWVFGQICIFARFWPFSGLKNGQNGPKNDPKWPNLQSNVAKRLLKLDRPLLDQNLDYHWAARSETSYRQSEK